MGVLRFYLALCVISTHAESAVPWRSHDGREALQIFFLMSGFYMGLIQKKYESKVEFYASRFLRVFVPYWAALALVLVLSTVSGMLSGNWAELGPYLDYSENENGLLGMLFVTLSNVTIFFQDVVLYITHDPGDSVQFTTSFLESDHPLYRYLLIPQVWSIGVELWFYLLVPFLGRFRSRNLVAVICASLAIRIFTYESIGLDDDPWNYRFFPFELALFGMGLLSQRVYDRYKKTLRARIGKGALDRPVRYPAYVALLIASFVGINYVQEILSRLVGYNYSVLLAYVGWIGIMPVLFAFSMQNQLDRFLGEMTYPIFLIHVIVIAMVKPVMDSAGIAQSWLGEITAVVSFLISLILLQYIIFPMERKRHALARAIARKVGAVPPQTGEMHPPGG